MLNLGAVLWQARRCPDLYATAEPLRYRLIKGVVRYSAALAGDLSCTQIKRKAFLRLTATPPDQWPDLMPKHQGALGCDSAYLSIESTDA